MVREILYQLKLEYYEIECSNHLVVLTVYQSGLLQSSCKSFGE